MKKITQWPPPENWTEVVIMWDSILGPPYFNIKKILHWADTAPGGNYHLHGYNSTEGFAFRFENEHDATIFKLGCQ